MAEKEFRKAEQKERENREATASSRKEGAAWDVVFPPTPGPPGVPAELSASPWKGPDALFSQPGKQKAGPSPDLSPQQADLRKPGKRGVS